MANAEPRCAWISRVVWELMVEEVARKTPLETGGVLVGYWSDSTLVGGRNPAGSAQPSARFDAVVTNYVGPGPRAIHTPRSFTPDHDYHANRVAEIYRRSARRDLYLGDWHSHPGADTTLSSLDKRTLRRIARSNTARCKTPLMLILDDAKAPAAEMWCGSLEKRSVFLPFTALSLTRLDIILF
jgi:integrative and conjugative element protein (TIGR02256 family)